MIKLINCYFKDEHPVYRKSGRFWYCACGKKSLNDKDYSDRNTDTTS